MTKNILLIGGTGFIGNKIYQLLLQRNADFSIYIGSRNPKSKNHIHINLWEPQTLTVIKEKNIDLVVLCTNDNNDLTLNFCIDNQINYIDITKPAKQLQKSYHALKSKKINSRIIFSSRWMSGIISGLLNLDNKIKEINISIYYSSKNKSGPSSTDFIAENINIMQYIKKIRKSKLKIFNTLKNINSYF
ncbi:MAG: hypothetical protein J6581_05035 [Apibacter sp.]|nr:hypothetical protein [Apibacter sp.]